jgi:competence protein ComEC
MPPDAANRYADFLFVDVGQGDCTVAVDPEARAALIIDCPSKGVRPVTAIANTYGSGLAISVMLSHWDHDHFGGFLRLASGLAATALYYNLDTMMSPDDHQSIRRARMLQLLEEPFRLMNPSRATDGDVIHIGSIEVRVLAPSHLHATEAVAKVDRNLGSVVALLSYHGFAVLVGGDADGRVWDRLLRENRPMKANVLRVPHHGGSLGRDTRRVIGDLADAVKPQYSIVSVGTNNPYGHPFPEVIKLLAHRSKLARTQVTAACHASLDQRSADVPCGGTVGFRAHASGSFDELHGWSKHDATVAGWNQPMCRNAAPPKRVPANVVRRERRPRPDQRS